MARRVFVDGEELDWQTLLDEEPPKGLLGSRGDVSWISRGQNWTRCLEALREDPVLNQVVGEYATALNPETMFTVGLMDMLAAVTTNCDAACRVVRALLGRSLTDDLVCFIREMFHRYVLWTVICGGAPLTYARVRDLDGQDWDGDLKLHRAALVRRDGADTDRLFESVPDLSDEASLDAFEALGKTWTGRDVQSTLADIDREERGRVALLAMQAIKVLRDGYMPYIPQVETCNVVYLRSTRRWVAFQNSRRGYDVFRWVFAPKNFPGDPLYRSAVGDGYADSLNFRALNDTFSRALMINSKRSIVVAPPAGDSPAPGQDQTTSAAKTYLGFLMDRYPQAVYDDLINHKSLLSAGPRQFAGQLMTDSAAAALVPPEILPCGAIPNLGGSGGLHTGSLVESLQDATKKRLVSDVWAMVTADDANARSYEALGRYLEAHLSGDKPLAGVLYQKLTEVDKSRMLRMVQAQQQDQQPAPVDKPHVHRLEGSTKLISMYTPEHIAVPDLEELRQLWTVSWKTRLSNQSQYTKRRNNLQYSGKNSREEVGEVTIIRQHFLAMVNYTSMKLMKTHTEKELQVSDLFILYRMLNKTVGLKTVVANTLGLLPSEVSFVEVPEEEAQGGLQGVSNEVISVNKN